MFKTGSTIRSAKMKAMPPETDGLFGLIPEMCVLRMQLTHDAADRDLYRH
jgi:hypothetical protein